MEESDEIITEEAEYSTKSEFSKPKIVFNAMQKCIESRAKEMKPGYENTKLTRDGLPIRTWVEDSRLVFIGSVIALKSLLSPEIKNNSKYSEKINDFEKTINEKKETYSYEEMIRNHTQGTITWEKTGRKYIPEIGSVVVLPSAISPGIASEIKGGWDNKTNLYWDMVLQEYDLMFACLNRLINQLNFFKQKISY